ncbi:hypothetical protein VB620_15495 [Nodularia harveyana UHCC-0300]|uniref:Isopropylmalate/homocitrate/citramalate synthase n=1 Tax=Nodularia harveyana UHCC-0300 TaxID=2974287 RepID=A0ABU5UIB6_9CYAN|nr:hypothetical protein [Nodularia harveyana]MEA5582741.1 hypothetical protein [Nodularia harveyana UHCC-0300]
MTEPNQEDQNKFIYPRSRYYGKFQPKNLAFNANLQEFEQKVGYISCLETSGKLTPQEAYQRIKTLWKQLKHSKKELRISNELEPPTTP